MSIYLDNSIYYLKYINGTGGRNMLVIYDLWLLVIGWGLYLNGLRILACMLFLIGFIFFLKSNIKMNCWRYLLCMSITAIFNIAISQYGSFNKDLITYTFLILESLLVSLSYELMYKLKIERLMNIYFLVAISFLSFLLIAYIIPDTSMYLEYKLNVVVYIALIFIPSFLLQSIQMLKKMCALSNKIKAWNH